MSDPGICKKYGKLPALVAAYTVPMGFGGAINYALYQSVESAASAANFSMYTGAIGFVTAIIAHDHSDVDLRKKGVGITRGAAITRRRQAIAYAIPALCLSTFAASFNYNGLDTQTQSFPTEQSDADGQNPDRLKQKMLPNQHHLTPLH